MGTDFIPASFERFFPVKPDMLSGVVGRVSSAVASHLDRELKKALDGVLGEGDWEMEDLRGRLERVVVGGRDVEIYELDGESLLEVYPLSYGLVEEGEVKRVEWSREVKHLWCAGCAYGEEIEEL